MPEAQRTPRVVVVGAGIAGLVSALVLAHRGLDVTLVESAATPGGKIRQVQVDGVGVDSGTTGVSGAGAPSSAASGGFIM